MSVPLPVSRAVLTSARGSGCRYSSVCLATLTCSLFQAPDPERSRESFCGVFGRGPRAGVPADSGESSACPPEIANAEALGENSPALACRATSAFGDTHRSESATSLTRAAASFSGSHGGGWISPRLI